MSSCASASNSNLLSSVFVRILLYILSERLRYFENNKYFKFRRFAVVGDFTRISFFFITAAASVVQIRGCKCLYNTLIIALCFQIMMLPTCL